MGRILTPDQIRMPIRKNEASKGQLFKAAVHFEQENTALRQHTQRLTVLLMGFIHNAGGKLPVSDQTLAEMEQKYTGFKMNKIEDGWVAELVPQEEPYVNKGQEQDSDTSDGESNKRDDGLNTISEEVPAEQKSQIIAG